MEVTIRDNGVGMSPEVAAKIFSPFFTTKESSRSTGLGLTLSHEIVREHGGQIVPASEPGEYTEMTVQLPRIRANRAKRNRPREIRSTLDGQSGRGGTVRWVDLSFRLRAEIHEAFMLYS